VAVGGRREQEASFFTVIVWRDQAEQSLAKGSRVVVVRRLQQRSWTAEDGSARSTVEGGGGVMWADSSDCPACASGWHARCRLPEQADDGDNHPACHADALPD
jgi:hypothetical protein